MYADQAGNQKSAAVANGPPSDTQRAFSNVPNGPDFAVAAMSGLSGASPKPAAPHSTQNQTTASPGQHGGLRLDWLGSAQSVFQHWPHSP